VPVPNVVNESAPAADGAAADGAAATDDTGAPAGTDGAEPQAGATPEPTGTSTTTTTTNGGTP
jgi:hypothetical protein